MKCFLQKLIILSLVSSLVGCNTKKANEVVSSEINKGGVEATSSPEMTPEVIENETEIVPESNQEVQIDENVETELDEQQNSFSMMCYLALIAEEIRTSKDNRLVLEDIYTSLLNDINPGAIDEITQDHLQNLRDIIYSYLNISTKRDRLQYIYNQEKAAAIRSAVPNPLAILSVSSSLDWKKLAVSVVYTVVDSYNSYKESSDNADMSFIMSGWELDDEETETIRKNRDRAFDYMVDMVQEYHLDGMKTLNEKAIEKFNEICQIENATERIKRFKAEESTYEALGNYWLELADAYFEISQYSACLECVTKYKNLSAGIYRTDYNYLQILPKAIVAAQEIYEGNKYIDSISNFASEIIENTTSDDWSIRYFVAQVYLDLYQKSNDKIYLEKAYKIASENTTVLLDEQRSINNTYLNDVEELKATEPDYSYMSSSEKKEAKKEYKAEKNRVKKYNKTLKEERKTELLSLYEPLVLNCELLFGLADKLDIDDNEKKEIEAILGTENNTIFLVNPINASYSFSSSDIENSIELSKKEIVIPANLLTAESQIVINVTDGDTVTTFDDCVVEKVKREGETIDTFYAYIYSKKMKKYNWTADSKVDIQIVYSDANDLRMMFKFEVSTFEDHWYGDKVEFKAL